MTIPLASPSRRHPAHPALAPAMALCLCTLQPLAAAQAPAGGAFLMWPGRQDTMNPVSALGVAGTVGREVSVQILVTGSPLRFTATGLPPGLSLHPATGLLSGRPSGPGLWVASVTATYARDSISAQLYLVVPPPPAGTSAADQPPVPPERASTAGTVTVRPQRDDAMLLNPGKGWVQYFAPDSSTRELIAVGYNRWNWRNLEPEEGRFDWSPIDNCLTSFAKHGKKFACRVMNINGGVGTQYATPKWVFDAGAVPLEIPDATTPTRTHIIPANNMDAVYLAKMKAFIAAFGARYNGHPGLAFLDMGNYGNWGEGNGDFWRKSKDVTPEQLKEDYLLPYFKAFPDTLLIVNGMDWRFGQVFAWAVAQGAGRRTDGIVSGSKNGNGGNGAGSQTLVCYPHHPGIMEYYGGFDTYADLAAIEADILRHVAGGRPSYLQFQKALYEKDPAFFRMIGNLLGYHLVLQQVVIPASIRQDRPFPIAWQWLNDGVAPPYEPCHVALALLDQHGQVVQRQWLDGCRPQQWKPGETITDHCTLTFPSLPLGTFQLAVGLFLARTDAAPAYRLGIRGRTPTGWYVLSEVASVLSR